MLYIRHRGEEEAEEEEGEGRSCRRNQNEDGSQEGTTQEAS